MLTEELSIFKDAKSLSILIMKYYTNLPNAHKYRIGAKMYDTALEILILIIYANKNKAKRIENLEIFLNKCESLKAYISLCDECRLLSQKEIAKLTILLESILKQATGWKNSASLYQVKA